MKKTIIFATLLSTLSSCHTQRALTVEQRSETDSVHVAEETLSLHLADSLLSEFTLLADSLSLVALPDSVVHLVARGAQLMHRTERRLRSSTSAALHDTSAVHARDSTLVADQQSRTALYEPPNPTWVLVLLLFLTLITARMVWKK